MEYPSFNIKNWIKGIIRGGAGFNAYRIREAGGGGTREDVAAWVIRCLGHVRCEGAGAILRAVLENRAHNKGIVGNIKDMNLDELLEDDV